MSSGKVSTRLGRRRTTHDTENPLSNREVPCFIGNLPGCNRMHILHIYIWIDIYFYVYIYICSTCTGIYIYLHIYNIYCIYIHTHTHGCLHVLFHVFLNPCKSIQKYWFWLYLFISKCMYVCIYICMCIYICLSLHPHRTILCGSLSVCYIAVATPETILKLKMSQTHASGWLTVLDGFGSTIHQIL